MKTASSDRLAIRGFGLAAGPGQSLGEIHTNLDEDADVFTGHPGFYNNAFDPQLCAFQETGEITSFEDRAIALCDAALADCLTDDQPEAPITVTVLLPEADPATGMHRERVIAYSAQIHEHLASALGKAGITVAEWRFANQGQAALGHAVAGGETPVNGDHLVIGADSFCDKTRLFAAMGHGLLFSEKDKWGLVPGEAGGALWLSPQTAAVEERTVTGAGLAVETVPERDPRPSDHMGLSVAIRNASATVQKPGPTLLVSDVNNGRYRSAEVAYAMHRALGYCLHEDCQLEHAPMTFGDCGAAAGFTALGLATRSEPGTRILITLSAISGARAALFVQV